MNDVYSYKIACVIVTYNRKEYLKRCLDAVEGQNRKPDCVFIIDNASKDGTEKFIIESGYNKRRGDVIYKYVRCHKNMGGAGGFYLGIKIAFEENVYEGLWVIDGDGEPEKSCLKELAKFLDNRDFIAPVVLSDEDHKSCSFVPNTTYEEFCKQANGLGIVEGWASPFNGILFSSRLIKQIGYPKKEMFIWGDEINYQLRAEKAGFHRMTSVKAIHYHPMDRQLSVCNENTLNVVVVPVESDWKLYCAIRNRVYNLHLLYNYYVTLKKAYELYRAYKTYYHSINVFDRDSLILKAVISGFCGYWKGLKQYIK